MKVLIQNKLVDLALVHTIELNEPSTRRFNDSHDSGDDETDWMWTIDIHFINDKSQRILFIDGPTDEEETRARTAFTEICKFWSPKSTVFPIIC